VTLAVHDPVRAASARPTSRCAVVVSSSVHRRLAVRESLLRQGLLVTLRRTSYDLERALRIYRPRVLVIDGSCLPRQALLQLRPPAGTDLFLLESSELRLPPWARSLGLSDLTRQWVTPA
jgi:hypothetical protein